MKKKAKKAPLPSKQFVYGYKFTSQGLQELYVPTCKDIAIQASQAKPDTTRKVIKKSSCIPTIQIYTDGACFPNPGGPGGYGVVIYEDNNIIHETQGFSESTTNNRMELMGILTGLCSIRRRLSTSTIEILSDSTYALNVLHKWKPKVNQDIIDTIKDILKECSGYQLTWVKGHSDCVGNIRADQLSTGEVMLNDQ